MAFNYDYTKLQNAYAKAKENSGNFDNTPLPAGKYHVKVEKLEIGETKDGVPMGKIQFRILEGEHKNKCLFMNQVLFGFKDGELTAFGCKIFDDFVESLDHGYEDVKFSDCNGKDPVGEYSDCMLDVAEAIEYYKYDIELSYTKDKNDSSKEYAKYKVLDVYK